MTTTSATTSPTSGPPLVILGVPFDNVTTAQAVQTIEDMVRSRRPHYVVTANVDFVVQIRKEPELKRLLLDAHLAVCDGMPLVWASRLLGNPLPERVTGADLVPLLIALSARQGYRIYFLGGTPEVAAAAEARLREQYPNLAIAGFDSPPFNPLVGKEDGPEMDHEGIKSRIREARPDFLFVSFGCPKQEKWIGMHYQDLGVPVSIGVGATIDFLAGAVKRAPVWMQRSGLEWVWRMAQEPRRLARRYFTGVRIFGFAILGQIWHLRRRRHVPHPSPAEITSTARLEIVKLPARFDAASVQADEAAWQKLIDAKGAVLVDGGEVSFIDSTGLGILVKLQRQLRSEGHPVVLAPCSATMESALRKVHLESFFHLAADKEGGLALIETLRAETPVAEGGTENHQIMWQGEVTSVNHLEVRARTEAAIQEAAAAGVPLRIDQSAIRFIDTSGIGTMVACRRLARKHLIDVVFLEPSEIVRKVAASLRMADYLFGAPL